MRKTGLTLVEIMIIIAIVALLASFALPNLITARKTSNEAAAKATIRSLSTAAEAYATANKGQYPVAVSSLAEFITSASDYCEDLVGTTSTVQGYNYACTMTATGYTFVAAPVTAGTTGSITYTATTGGVLTPL